MRAAHQRRYEALGREIARRYGRPVAQRSDGSPGERVRRYRLQARVGGDWQQVSAGSCLGHKKIDTFAPVVATALRLQCLRSEAEPQIANLAALTEA